MVYLKKRSLRIPSALFLLLFVLAIPLLRVSAAPYQPKTIRVRMSNGSIKKVYFEEYLRDVLPKEMYSTWGAETLKAGAVAARTFAWWRINNPMGSSYDLTNTSQAYVPGSARPSTTLAVNNTAGWRIEPYLCSLSS